MHFSHPHLHPAGAEEWGDPLSRWGFQGIQKSTQLWRQADCFSSLILRLLDHQGRWQNWSAILYWNCRARKGVAAHPLLNRNDSPGRLWPHGYVMDASVLLGRLVPLVWWHSGVGVGGVRENRKPTLPACPMCIASVPASWWQWFWQGAKWRHLLSV